jgi:hypothetical protein
MVIQLADRHHKSPYFLMHQQSVHAITNYLRSPRNHMSRNKPAIHQDPKGCSDPKLTIHYSENKCSQCTADGLPRNGESKENCVHVKYGSTQHSQGVVFFTSLMNSWFGREFWPIFDILYCQRSVQVVSEISNFSEMTGRHLALPNEVKVIWQEYMLNMRSSTNLTSASIWGLIIY